MSSGCGSVKHHMQKISMHNRVCCALYSMYCMRRSIIDSVPVVTSPILRKALPWWWITTAHAYFDSIGFILQIVEVYSGVSRIGPTATVVSLTINHGAIYRHSKSVSKVFFYRVVMETPANFREHRFCGFLNSCPPILGCASSIMLHAYNYLAWKPCCPCSTNSRS